MTKCIQEFLKILKFMQKNPTRPRYIKTMTKHEKTIVTESTPQLIPKLELIPERAMQETLHVGDSGDAVSFLQSKLGILESSMFDTDTESSVLDFQSSKGLLVDGIVGTQTWSALLNLQPLREEKSIIESPLSSGKGWDNTRLSRTWEMYGGLLEAVSSRLEIPCSSLLAVLMVESRGEPFGSDGRPIIRFENHIFWSWGKHHPDVFNEHFRFGVDSTVNWKGHWFRESSDDPWTLLHVNNKESQMWEWKALNFARTLDNVAAIRSASFGLGQVIGFNAEKAGYDDLDQFVEDMYDEKMQILAMTELIRNGRTMLPALWESDFYKFAKEYNGPGQPDAYSKKIRQYAEEAQKYLPT